MYAFCVWHFQQSCTHSPKIPHKCRGLGKYRMKCLAEYFSICRHANCLISVKSPSSHSSVELSFCQIAKESKCPQLHFYSPLCPCLQRAANVNFNYGSLPGYFWGQAAESKYLKSDQSGPLPSGWARTYWVSLKSVGRGLGTWHWA